jgi:hypothetical protein
VSEPLLGVNFSHRQAAWLGLDPDEAFRDLVDRLRVRRFRLSLYWEEIQPEPTRYDFTTLHRQLDLLEARNAKALITVGLKAQRHPEFYPPLWLGSSGLPARGAEIRSAERLITHLMLMLERAVALLADYRAVDAWQVENEPFQPAAGRTSGWRIAPATLEREIAAVRGSDPRNRPIVLNYSSNTIWDLGWLRTLRQADVLAQDIYTRKPGGPFGYVNPHAFGPFGPGLLTQSILAHRFGREFWITELQAEPWETTPQIELDDAQIGSISPKLLEKNLRLARGAHPERIYLWGAEWWLRQRQRGDSRYWDLAAGLFGN